MILLANILRVLTVSEIAFTLGVLAFRVYDRHSRFVRICLAVALAIYSTLAGIVLISRYNEPATWKLPIITVAATFSVIGVIRRGGSR
jgi:hypothetical protein